MSLEIENNFFPHDASYRALDKEQRRRMLDFHGPERIKQENAHKVAKILKIPFRAHREFYGPAAPFDIKFLSQIDREYWQVIEAEKEERERRIKQFEDLDIEIAFSLAHIIRESKNYAAPEFAPEITIDTERSMIASMRKLKKEMEEEAKPTISHREINEGWISLALHKISDVVKHVIVGKTAAGAAQ